MSAESGSTDPRAVRRLRLAALSCAVVLGAAALVVARHDALPAPAWLSAWTERHPDPRVLSGDDAALLQGLQGAQRRADVLCLLVACALGCLALAVRPRLAGALGGARAAVLVCGSVGLGLGCAALSVAGQVRAAQRREWSLGDDTLEAVAGVHAPTLRAWRQTVPEGDAIILLGTDSYLWNVVSWALHPRPVYPLVRELPPEMTEAELIGQLRPRDFALGHGARWVVDLAALRASQAGSATAHAALVRVDP